MVIEGLEKRFFETRARSAGAKGDAKWGSLLWAREALKAVGTDDAVVSEVIQSLMDLKAYWSKLSGAHSGADEAKKLRAKLLRAHKTPRGHVEVVCGQVLRSLETLRDVFA